MTSRILSFRFRMLILAVIGIISVSVWFPSAVVTAGFRIPQRDMLTDYAQAVLLAFAIGIGFSVFPASMEERQALVRLWIVKCIVTLVIMLLYEWNYGLDAYEYFSVVRKQAPILTLDRLRISAGSRNLTILLSALTDIIPIRGSYHGEKVLLSSFGLLASFLIYRAVRRYDSRPGQLTLLYVLGLFPSVLFWSSILGKEPVQYLGIALFLYGTLTLRVEKSIRSYVALFAGLSICVMIRSWTAGIIFVPLLFLAAASIRNLGLRVILLAMLSFGFIFAIRHFLTTVDLDSYSDLMGRLGNISRSWERGGSANVVPEFSSLSHVLMFIPVGATTALFRPLPFEVYNLFGLFAGFENGAILFVLIRALLRDPKRLVDDFVSRLAVVTATIWSIFYGFISYQNMGAAVRFRLQVLPYLILLFWFEHRSRLEKEPLLKESK